MYSPVGTKSRINVYGRSGFCWAPPPAGQSSAGVRSSAPVRYRVGDGRVNRVIGILRGGGGSGRAGLGRRPRSEVVEVRHAVEQPDAPRGGARGARTGDCDRGVLPPLPDLRAVGPGHAP